MSVASTVAMPLSPPPRFSVFERRRASYARRLPQRRVINYTRRVINDFVSLAGGKPPAQSFVIDLTIA